MRLTGVEPADVTSNRHDAARKRGELLRGGLKVFELAAGDDDASAGLGQPAGDGLADAAPAAGDEGDFALEIRGGIHG